MTDSNIETVAISTDVIVGETYRVTGNEFIYRIIKPKRTICLFMVGVNRYVVRIVNPDNDNMLEFDQKKTPIYFCENMKPCHIEIISYPNHSNEIGGTIKFNGIDTGKNYLRMTFDEMINFLGPDAADEKNRYKCVIVTNPPVVNKETIRLMKPLNGKTLAVLYNGIRYNAPTTLEVTRGDSIEVITDGTSVGYDVPGKVNVTVNKAANGTTKVTDIETGTTYNAPTTITVEKGSAIKVDTTASQDYGLDYYEVEK